MNCENIFCIYQKENKCTLRSVSINSLGMCTECIQADIDKDILDNAKSKLLGKFNL